MTKGMTRSLSTVVGGSSARRSKCTSSLHPRRNEVVSVAFSTSSDPVLIDFGGSPVVITSDLYDRLTRGVTRLSFSSKGLGELKGLF